MTEHVLSGSYRNVRYDNVKVKLLGNVKRGAKGWFVQVDGTGYDSVPQHQFKLNITEDIAKTLPGITVSDSWTSNAPKPGTRIVAAPELDSNETDQERTQRIAKRFGVLERMAYGTATGSIRSLIVSGAPGVGKSFTVERALEEESAQGRCNYNSIKGNITPIQLYRQLHEFREPGDVLLLDDCDAILFNETALNLLKSALDTTARRRVSWMSDTIGKGDDGIESNFYYDGTMIFITNIDFQRLVDERKGKLVPHFEALMSRSLYLDLTLRSKRDLVLWIEHVVMENQMLLPLGLTVAQSEEVLVFLKENVDRLRTISLREATKAASLLKADPKYWKDTADIVMLKPALANSQPVLTDNDIPVPLLDMELGLAGEKPDENK